MDGLIGYTGFVGQNLDSGCFGARYHSKNIGEICGKEFDLLVCAGVPGHKTLANQFPDQDWASVQRLLRCLEQVKCRKLIFISTVDVFAEGVHADEDTPVSGDGLSCYGRHRVMAEEWITGHFEDPLIVRLPGIFGKGLKKNFIYDLMVGVPAMMNPGEVESLEKAASAEEWHLVCGCYHEDSSGLWTLRPRLEGETRETLRGILERYGLESLRFTDSRSIYSYYYLEHLWKDVQMALDQGICLIHLVTEPMSAGEIAKRAFGRCFDHVIPGRRPAEFAVRSRYGNREGYFYSKEQVLEELKEFGGTKL